MLDSTARNRTAACKRVADTPRARLRVLYMSGYAGNAFVHRAGHPSDIVFLSKPFTAGGLSRTVREAFDR